MSWHDILTAVYFDQQTSAVQGVCWSKSFFVLIVSSIHRVFTGYCNKFKQKCNNFGYLSIEVWLKGNNITFYT